MTSLRKLIPVLLLVTLLPARADAYTRGKHTEVIDLPAPMDLLTGRFPRHIPEYVGGPAMAPPAEGSYEQLAWRVRFGGGADDPAAYEALAVWHAVHGDDDLAWWARQRAMELGSPARATLAERNAALADKWRAAGRKDPPTEAQFGFVRAGADRWVKAYQIAERQAFSDKEHVADEAVQRRIGEQADMQVPPAILGADSFMRRWGVGLLIAAVGLCFWAFYLFAILRKRRRVSPASATS